MPNDRQGSFVPTRSDLQFVFLPSRDIKRDYT
jgi:hypothetical protein